eukprot:evm.model.scf_1695.2 EVM.evm.TU.scf_1695.2   scf_1695:14330-21793(+)
MARNPQYGGLPGRHPVEGMDLATLLNSAPNYGGAAGWGHHLPQAQVPAMRARESSAFPFPQQMQHFLGGGGASRQMAQQLGSNSAYGVGGGPVYPMPQAARESTSGRPVLQQHRSQVPPQLTPGGGHGQYMPPQPTAMPNSVGMDALSLGMAVWNGMGGWPASKGTNNMVTNNSNTMSSQAMPLQQPSRQVPITSPPFVANLRASLADRNPSSLLTNDALSSKNGGDTLLSNGGGLMAELMRGPPMSQDPQQSSGRNSMNSGRPALPSQPLQPATPPAHSISPSAPTAPSGASTPAQPAKASRKRNRSKKTSSKKPSGRPPSVPPKVDPTQPIVDFFQDVDSEELDINFDEYTFWDLNLGKDVDRQKPPRAKLARCAREVGTAPLDSQDDSRSARVLKWAFGEHAQSSWFQ